MKTFSLITYLTREEFASVRELQKKVSEITGSTKSLSDWQPHITIGDGPELTDEQIPEFEEKLQAFALQQMPISAKITGFGGIDNWKGAIPGEITPYVIWLTVEVNPELKQCWDELRESITSRYPTWLPRTETYVPHITLAFADLTEEGYQAGLRYLENEHIAMPFHVSHIALAECSGVGHMTSREYKRFEFKHT